MKKQILSLLFLVCLPGALHAEATKEFTRDAGLYGGNPSGTIRMDLKSWGFSVNTFNGEYTGLSDAPEGIKVVQMVLNSQWGGWGVANVDSINPTLVIARDFSEFQIANGSLRFLLKSDKLLWVEIEHTAQGSVGRVPVNSTGNQWQEIVIPLSSFTGVDWTKIRFPFIIRVPDPPNGNPSTWYVDHIRWTKPVTSLAIFPTTTTVGVNRRRQFTVEGRNAGERVIIYSTFTASAGAMNPAFPNFVTASILTAPASAGAQTVTAKLVNLSTSANVSVTTSNIDEPFGLLSETIPGLLIDTDSKLFYDSGGGGGAQWPTTLDEVSSDNREGSKRFKITILNQTAAASFSGIILNWGVDDSTHVVRDMSKYYDGSIRFWFKAPAALQAGMVVGVRSANCDLFNGEPTELSKISLKDYATFDGNWHPVVIPANKFTGARPWADLSRMKILFTIFATGPTGGDQTFYMDNLRWDTQTPGALDHMAVSPNPVRVPLNAKRMFTARGFDANNIPVDISPVWSTTGSIGSLSSAQGVTTLLSASAGSGTGTITATEAGISSTTNVTVASFIYTQSHNVYSDAGSGGVVGVSTGGAAGATMLLSQQPGGVSSDPATFRRSTYTLVNSADQTDAYAVWYTDEQNGSRYMRFYKDGYLHFWVKTARDLQFSLRSNNIDPGTERCKFRLSELGVPLNNTFQEVLISLEDFKGREPLLDFDQIKTYFVIGALSSQIGEVTNEVFDVDDVKWLTASPDVPSEAKVYAHLQEKQNAATGLVLSFDNDASFRSVTYDQALAVMNYTYRKDTGLAKKALDVYKTKFDGGGFAGFHEEYKWNNVSTILDSDRTAGPNAWLMLSAIHYRNVATTDPTTYDPMIDGVASWLKSLQDTDGAIKYGFLGSGGTAATFKSTEHNFDCYAAFLAYYKMTGNLVYKTAADNILTWLKTEAWNGTRFNVGENSDGSANPDKALDVYSWAPLALSSFTSVLPLAEIDFRNTHTCDLTGVPVDGFDFSAMPGAAPDKDAVWLEGTAQMALAYYAAENKASGDHFVNELEKSIVGVSADGQGMAYATNAGTAYGFIMDSLQPAVSSMAWYLFAKKNFNPFRPFSLHAVQPKNISNNVAASSVTWTVAVPDRWVRANQYIQLDAQPISVDVWGIIIYTDNLNPLAQPRFVDITPGVSTNADSNPAGMLLVTPGQPTSSVHLPLAWSIKDSTSAAPPAFDPTLSCPSYLGPAEAYQWFFMKDKNTPALDGNSDGDTSDLCVDGDAFSTPPEDYVRVRKSPGQLHTGQGDTYVDSFTPDYIYIEGDFTGAAAQAAYQTSLLTIEFFIN